MQLYYPSQKITETGDIVLQLRPGSYSVNFEGDFAGNTVEVKRLLNNGAPGAVYDNGSFTEDGGVGIVVGNHRVVIAVSGGGAPDIAAHIAQIPPKR